MFLDDLLVLEFDELTLFLEISHNLVKATLEQVDFSLQFLDLLVLFVLLLSSLHILTHLALKLALKISRTVL